MNEQPPKHLDTRDTMKAASRELTRRQLACGLDELEKEAFQFERTLIQMLNAVRALQGKTPVKLRD